MNRQQRRLARANAGKVAKTFAAACFDYSDGGGLIRVTHPRALQLLERAFTHMLRHGCEPHVIRLTQKDAATFPRGDQGLIPDAPSWLGVGLDVDARGTCCLQHCKTPGADPTTERRIAEDIVLARLKAQQRRPGFPMPEMMGGSA